MASISVPVFVDGFLSASNIKAGMVTVAPTPNVSTGATVTGLDMQGTGNLFVQATAVTGFPRERLQNVTVSSVGPSGFTINVLRTDSTSTPVFWFATRNP